jgi:tetratricopeptide (TPR) repeat protein
VGATKLRYINESEARAAPEATSVKPAPTKPEPDSKLAVREEKKPASDTSVSEQALARPELPPPPPVRRDARAVSRKKEKLKEGFEKKKKLILIAAGAGLSLCLLVVAVFSGGKEELKVLEPLPNLESAESYMSKVREAVRQGLYEEALAFLEHAKTIDPNIDSSNLGAQIELERDTHQKLQEVVEFLSQKEFQKAKVALDKIPDASARLKEEKKKLSERISQEELQAYLERTEELLMLGDFDAASDAMRLLPRAQQAAIGEKIEAGRASYEEAERQKRVKIQVGAQATQKAREAARKQQVVLAFAEVQRKFNGEDWKRAADECDRVFAQHSGDAEIRKKAKELQKQILEFGQAYDEGSKKYRAGQIAAAAKPLAKARTLYSKMGFTSAVDGSLREMLSQAALLAGEDSLARGDYAAAAAHFKEAQKMQPSSERAKRGLERVVAKAEDLFGMAYSLKPIDPKEALRYFNLIVEITPRGSHWNERAKNQINAMSPEP